MRQHAFQRRQNPAVGTRRAKKAGVETGIVFDEEMFQAIRKRAVREHTTFSEQVRTLCQWGLDADSDETQR